MVLSYILYTHLHTTFGGGGRFDHVMSSDETVGLLKKEPSATELKPERVGPRGADSPHDFDVVAGPASPSSFVPSKNSAFNSL